MKKILLISLILMIGCSSPCACLNESCGPKCRLQCEENRCTPGEKCCEKCTCDPLKK
jgi:hypothetical protein